jgi:hypothetical protein
MILPFGSPKLYSHDDQPIIDVISFYGKMFITLSSNSVSLWSTRPTAMLSSTTSSSRTLEEDGENLKGFWDSRGHFICVQTSKGFLHIYDVLYETDPKFEFKRPIDRIFGVGEASGVPNISIKFKMALEVESGITWYSSH